MASHLPRRFYASLEALAAAGDDHSLLVDALGDHHARRARALMEQHILASADHLIELLGQRGLWITQEPSSS